MQIAVNIPDEFAAQVESRGLKLESYVEQLVAERAAAPRGYGAGGRLTREEFRACLDSMTEDADEIPSLPDEALSRESIYSDHD
jgi:hypothetical protein